MRPIDRIAAFVVLATLPLAGCGGASDAPGERVQAPISVTAVASETPAPAATASPTPSATVPLQPTVTTATETPTAPPTTKATPTAAPSQEAATPTAARTAEATQSPASTPTPVPQTPTPAPTPTTEGAPLAVTVNVAENFFSPRTTTVGVSGTVTWVWTGKEIHDVAGPFGASGLVKNAVFARTFDTPGTYDYRCTIHVDRNMRGTIIVQ